MNRKILTVVFFLILAILIGIPESFARPQYFASLVAVYGGGSCGTCHVSASGGGPRNSYGTLFENQPNHSTDPGSALTAIGPPPATSTQIAAETPATPEVTATAAPTPAAPGFGIVVSVVGIFACAFVARRYK